MLECTITTNANSGGGQDRASKQRNIKIATDREMTKEINWPKVHWVLRWCVRIAEHHIACTCVTLLELQKSPQKNARKLFDN